MPKKMTLFSRSRKFYAIKDYRKYYEDPIIVQTGEQITWTPKDSEWAGWRWCIHPATKKEGWVPENALQINGSSALVLRNYSAAELNAKTNEAFTVLKEESGWYWCQNSNHAEGWLPKELFNIDERSP
jgi:hypothetical protein